MKRPLRIRPRRRRGITVLELLVASSLTVIIVFAAIGALLTTMTSWYRGAGQIAAETSAKQAIRTIASELRPAMEVIVDNDGNGLTYRLPERDADGDFQVPPEWDGVTRRIELDVASDPPVLRISDGHDWRVIARHVIARDPEWAGGHYRLFTPGEGTTVRQVTVKVATSTPGAGDERVTSRVRETIYLRNVP
jgi:hypothetical protein